jgi:hypothetical protein
MDLETQRTQSSQIIKTDSYFAGFTKRSNCMQWELLVESCEDRQAALLAVDKSSETEGLKQALRAVVLLGQAFSMKFQSKGEAEESAQKFRGIGFHCGVSTGPAPGMRAGATR